MKEGDSVTEFEFTINVDVSGGMDVASGSSDVSEESWVVEGQIGDRVCSMVCRYNDVRTVTVVYSAQVVNNTWGGVQSETFQSVVADLLKDFLEDSSFGLVAIFDDTLGQ